MLPLTEKFKKSSRLYLDLLACLLVFSAHFSNYIIYIGYTRVFPDLLVSAGLLLAIAIVLAVFLQLRVTGLRTAVFSILVLIVLSDVIYEFGTSDGGVRFHIFIPIIGITLFLVFFLRRQINKVLIVAFSAILLSTPIFQLPLFSVSSEQTRASTKIDNTLPLVVHLILDEHMGVGGMTNRLLNGDRIRKSIEHFYVENDFRLFSRAYSEYFDTHSSLATSLNADYPNSAQVAVKHRDKYILTKNSYLNQWAENGYAINILQSSYFDFCRNEAVQVESCTTYKHDAFDEVSVSTLPLKDRITLISTMYYSSLTMFRLLKLIEIYLRKLVDQSDVSHSVFGLWHGRIGPLAVRSSFDALIDNVSKSQGGELFFAHLLMPHYPYVYDSHCSIRTPISSWQTRQRVDGRNSQSSRQQRYLLYFEQVECTIKLLDHLFAAMKKAGTYENSIIIVHGDHGSRITRMDPDTSNVNQLTIDDYIDSYSTLYAIKKPNMQPGIDGRMMSLPDLSLYALGLGPMSAPEMKQHFIYLPNEDGPYIRWPLPYFP